VSDCPECSEARRQAALWAQPAFASAYECYACQIRRLKSQLAAALARVEAAELENRAWRALAEWERYTNDRAVSMEDCGMRKHGDPARISAYDGSFGDFEGAGDSVQAAAIDLATQLGLLNPESGAKGEGGGDRPLDDGASER